VLAVIVGCHGNMNTRDAIRVNTRQRSPTALKAPKRLPLRLPKVLSCRVERVVGGRS
jgi:hypothetical protein